MQKYECDVCGYIYDPAEGDPDNGVKPGTSFEDVPSDWVCPLCGVGKEDFSPVDQSPSAMRAHKKITWSFCLTANRYSALRIYLNRSTMRTDSCLD